MAFTLIFLLVPFLSALPLVYGGALGLLLWLLQLSAGHLLVRKLLGLKTGKYGFEVNSGGCPFVFVLGGSGALAYSPEAEAFLATDAGQRAAEALKKTWRGLPGAVYERLLALPCLLRAFAAVTADYGRLRYAQGPLWYFGSCLGRLGRYLEKPLRWGRRRLLDGEGTPEEVHEALLLPLIKCERAAAWVGCLDIFSWVEFSEAKRAMAWGLSLGKRDFSDTPPAVIRTVPSWLPWVLALLMCAWVYWGGGLWGSPALFLGLGYLAKIGSEYDDGTLYDNESIGQLRFNCRFAKISLRGAICREDTPGLDDSWIRAASGEGADGENYRLFRLGDYLGWQFKEGEEAEVRGWLDGRDFSVTVESLRNERESLSRYPRLWRLLIPRFLAGGGLVWCLLQLIRL